MSKDASNDTLQTATFAAGCFWGVQYYFDQTPGVIESTVGYTGGHTVNPSYEQVCTHTTGHAEAVQLRFDHTIISYDALLQHFFRLHDPTQLNRQGPDIGDSYRSAIFVENAEQRRQAEQAREAAQADYKQPVVTEITDVATFYPAEGYHQKFTERTGRGMCHIPYEPLTPQNA